MLFFEITDLHRLLGHPSSKNDLEWDALTENDQFILEIKNLSIGLPKTADRAFAVEDASLQVNKGGVLCIVGERGNWCILQWINLK